MKPNFALKLSNDGIELLHRLPAGWSPVGSVSFDTDDVATACARLIDAAKLLAPEGISTKLIIPDSEVRYSTVVAPGPTDEARRYQIEAEIERLTPYSIDELAYDWAVEDDHALVVVCAHETLTEAETFADGYGFNPVAFVALPDAGQFIGEPFLGETSVARAYLKAGDKVQREAEPVRVITPRAAAAVPARPLAPAPSAVSGPAAASRPTPAPGPMPVPVQTVTKAPVPVAPAGVPKPAIPTAAAPTAALAPRLAPVTSLPPARADAPTPWMPVSSADTAPSVRPARRAIPDLGMGDAKAKVGDLVRRMGTRLRREQANELHSGFPVTMTPRPPLDSPASGKSGGLATPVDKDTAQPAVARSGTPIVAAPPPAPAGDESVSVAFASRRRPTPTVVSETRPDAVATAANPGGRIAMLSGNVARSGADRALKLLAGAQRGVRAAMARARSGSNASRADAPAPTRTAKVAPVIPAARPTAPETDKTRELEAMTLFGERGNRRDSPSLARRGLMAAGGLLLILVAVAIWALYFNRPDTPVQLAGDEGGATQVLPGIEAPQQLASAGTEQVTPPEALTPPVSPVVEAAADPVAPVADAPAPQDPPATPEPVADPDQMLETLVQEALNETLPASIPDAPAEAVPADPLAPADNSVADAGAAAPHADTAGAAQVSVSAAGPQTSDMPQVVATADQRMSLPSGIVVPPVAEVAFQAPPAPPPFGTEFTLDERGLVEATREGAQTPSGVMVFARRPAAVPAPRPVSILPPEPAPAPEPVAQPVPATEPVAAAIESAIAEAVGATAPADAPQAVATTEVIYDDTPRADPALAGARPQPRSARVRQIGEQQAPAVPEPDPGADQTRLDPQGTDAPIQSAALESPPPGGVSLDMLRPQPRPGTVVEQTAPADPQADGTASLDLTGATPEAVARSPRPGARPSDVAERARQILAAASAAAPTRGTPEDVETDEGETASAAQPVIPSSASVARQATESDAIRLNQINLIGVFGTANDRRALVRLSGGRMIRVQVGDQLDGGQVSAIGENELRYVKNGRNEVLRIGG